MVPPGLCQGERAPKAHPGMSDDAKYLMIPFDAERGNRERFTVILDFLCDHPSWVTIPCAPELRRVLFAHILTDKRNRIWEVWSGATLVGMLYLGEIRPFVSGTIHFVFMDRELVGKTDLLHAWFRECFQIGDFQSLLVYAPEFIPTYLHYCRRLGFRFQGEGRRHPAMDKLGMDNPHVWVAKQGSRREKAHWHAEKQEWQDVFVLRLTPSDLEAITAK